MIAQNNLINNDAAKTLENLTDEISKNLGGMIPHERIAQVVFEIASEYKDAAVTSFVPVFIQRYAKERLRGEIHPKDAR